MDIFFAEVTQILGRLFIFFWMAVAAGIGAYVLLHQYGNANKARTKKLTVIFVSVVGVYFSSVLISHVLLNYYANKRLQTFAQQHISSLIVYYKGKKIEIRDPRAIDGLLSIICSARKVSAHHSHPVEKINLFFPKAGYTYSLGKDSDRVDEFWLEWLSYRGSEPYASIMVVKQFNSRELRDWLREHVQAYGKTANDEKPHELSFAVRDSDDF